MTGAPFNNLQHPGQAATAALRRQDFPAAKALFSQATQARPQDTAAWFGLALACLHLGDDLGHASAVERVLAAQPNHVPALILQGDRFDRSGDDRAAEAFYRAALSRAPPLESLPPDLRQELGRAQRQCDRYARAFEAHLLDAIAQAGFDPATSSARFAQSLDLLLGKRQLYVQQPTSYYFPELPQRQFYERAEFPWLAAIEAQTAAIRAELLGVVGDDEAFQPYVRGSDLRPQIEFGDLRDNPDWSAFYLIEGGVLKAEAASRCPRTLEALSHAPLCAVPGRTPSVLFSLLRPGTRIPPHTGQINARLICHLPLIVPAGCGLRVGNEVRPWVEGEALIFDDTFEHEAWNDSNELRVVLLFEIWRPDLTPEERDLVTVTLASVASYRA